MHPTGGATFKKPLAKQFLFSLGHLKNGQGALAFPQEQWFGNTELWIIFQDVSTILLSHCTEMATAHTVKSSSPILNTKPALVDRV